MAAILRRKPNCHVLEVRKIKKIKIWEFDDDKECTVNFKRWVDTIYKLETMISPVMDSVTTNSEIVITTKPSRVQLVNRVSPGTHVNAIGAQMPRCNRRFTRRA